MVMPLVMSLQAMNQSYGAAGKFFAANNARTALANSVTGKETPQQIAKLENTDKSLELQAVNAKMNYQVAQIMMENAQKLQKANNDQKRRLMDNGFSFG